LAASATFVVAGLNAEPWAAVFGRPMGRSAHNTTVATITHPAAPVRQSRAKSVSCALRMLEHMVVSERAMSDGT
jgi:hypothetical protein